MKNILLIFTILIIGFSCNKKPEDPLILPPNFTEEPDLNNLEKNKKTTNKEDISKLKDLLLKSEE
jgi:hypothetical protein